MAKQLQKHMDVDVIAFLEEKMKSNTKHYQSDFDIDKKTFQRSVESPLKEDKTLLWLSRSHGTQCQRECEAFIKDTAAHNTWRYYESQKDSIVAYAVELTGKKDGIIRGNLYDLDYAAHVAEVTAKAVAPGETVQTFQDGFELGVAHGRGSYGYYLGFVADHGPIVHSLDLPQDKEALSFVLAEQKAAREQMKAVSPVIRKKPSLDEKILAASVQASTSSQTQKRSKESVR